MENLYLTAILPPEQLSNQIDEIRKDCSARFGVKAGLKPPVHITLFRPFKLELNLEEHIIKQLSPVIYNHTAFEISLENFSSFNNHTVFIRVIKSKCLSTLQRQISDVFNRNKVDPREAKGNTLFTPHITIAYRDIHPEVFPKIWDEYKNKKFKRVFTTDCFTLLKHDGKNWNIFKEFKLQKHHFQPTLFPIREINRQQ